MKYSLTLIAIWLTAILTGFTGTFRDSFDGGNDKEWERWGQGSWKVVDGQYTITSTSGVTGSIWGEAKWSHYTIEVKAHAIEADFIGIGIRHLDPNNCYGWALNIVDREMSWMVQFAGNWNFTTNDAIPGNPLEAHLYKVVVSADKFKGYFDGKLIHEWQDKRFKTGRVSVAICCDGSEAIFDNFVITGKGVPNAGFAVSSQGKLTTIWAMIKEN